MNIEQRTDTENKKQQQRIRFLKLMKEASSIWDDIQQCANVRCEAYQDFDVLTESEAISLVNACKDVREWIITSKGKKQGHI